MGAGAELRSHSKLITVGGPVGLVLGLVVGAIAHEAGAEWLASLTTVLEPLGRLWMNALRVIVVPLTVTLLVVGVCSLPRGRALGKWASLTIGFIVALLIAAGLVTVAASKAYLGANPPALVDLTLAPAAEEAGPATTDWVDALFPSALLSAESELLPIALIAILFGLALRTVPEQRRKPVESLFVGVRDAIMVYVHGVLLAVPLGAFALTFSFAAVSGFAVAAALAHFVAFVSGVLILVTLLVVAATLVASRGRVGRVAAAMGPLVAVAVGTRSSLASMPSLVEGVNDVGLPEPAADIVIPTCVSLFKMNRMVSTTAKMLFLAAMLGIVVSAQALVVFLGTVFLLSFATPGLPAGGSNSTWGAYMAVGVPIEAIALFDIAAPLTDFFKTALNVLADFAVAVFVSQAVIRTRSETSPIPSAGGEELAG